MVGVSEGPGSLNLHLHPGVLTQGYCRSHFEKRCSRRLGPTQGQKELLRGEAGQEWGAA